MQLPEAIDAVRPSVVQIAVDVGSHQVVVGTGFIAQADGLILTARHVAEAARMAAAQTAGRIIIRLALPLLTGPITIRGSFEILAAEVVVEDPRHDLAVMRLMDNPYAHRKTSGIFQTQDGGTAINALYGVAQLDERAVRDGETVAVSGYPMEESALVTTSGAIASAFGVDVAETQMPGAPLGFSVPDVADSYLADVAVNPGNSGGPVYRVEGGSVIGVCVAFRVASAEPQQGTAFFYNSGLTLVVPIRYAIVLLESATSRRADEAANDRQDR